MNKGMLLSSTLFFFEMERKKLKYTSEKETKKKQNYFQRSNDCRCEAVNRFVFLLVREDEKEESTLRWQLREKV